MFVTVCLPHLELYAWSNTICRLVSRLGSQADVTFHARILMTLLPSLGFAMCFMHVKTHGHGMHSAFNQSFLF